MSIGTFLVIWAIWIVLGIIIAQHKNLSVGQAVFSTAIIGIFGVIILLCTKPGLPKAPRGMIAVRCPRCAAVSNVLMTAPEFVCWQCKHSEDLGKMLVRR